MAIYASDPNARPDSEFEPGTLRHLAPQARGRMLDPRRTPISVLEVQPEIGFVRIRIEGFEDAGAIWQVPLEHVGHYQFELDGPGATDEAATQMEAALRRLVRQQTIVAERDAATRSAVRIKELQAEAMTWLAEHSRFLAQAHDLPEPSTRRGDPSLATDLEAYLRDHGLEDLEEVFARTFVSNPGSGEVVLGHRIVLAELGLADYAGPVVRDPATFSGDWTRERRAQHIVTRLAFVRALFGRLGLTRVTLWRGLSSPARLQHRDGRSFVSTSFAEAVARSHYQDGSGATVRVLTCRDVPVERVLMTYLETAAMNTVFLEAEAVVLDHPHDRWP